MKNKAPQFLIALAVVTLLAVMSTSCAALDPAAPGASDRAVTVLYGQQSFDDDAIDDDVRADTYGVQYEYVNPPGAFGDAENPIVSEVGYLYGNTETSTWVLGPGGPSNEFDVGLETHELYLGLRKDWRLGRWTPFLGAGLNLMLADVDALGGHDTDFNVGGYAKTGARYQLTERLSLGAEARYRLHEDFEVSNDDGSVSGDIGGLSALITLTWSF